jgi:hypothetical protein
MRDYPDQMTAPTQLAAPDVTYPRIIGADHVMIMVAGTDFADEVEQLVRLAPTLAALTAA